MNETNGDDVDTRTNDEFDVEAGSARHRAGEAVETYPNRELSVFG